MIKKFLVFISVILNVSCTNFVYNSFTKDRESMWKKSVSEQKNLYDMQYLKTDGGSAISRRPSFLVSSDTSLFVFYEVRGNTSATGEIGVDGQNLVDIRYQKSESGNAFTGSSGDRTIGKAATRGTNSHGSPVSFLANNKYLVLLSTSGAGFSSQNDSAVGKSKISVSRATERSGGAVWSEWEDLPDSVFDKIRNLGYNRFYTTSGNGLTLSDVEGTLVCTIDFATNDSVNNPKGFAILYSDNDGIASSWKVGGICYYNGNYRNAKIIAQTTDGGFLIGATPISSGNIKWYKTSSITSNPVDFAGPTIKNNGGKIEGYRLTSKESGHSKDRIIFAYTTEKTSGTQYKYALQVSISEDEGTNFSLTKVLPRSSGNTVNAVAYYTTINVLSDGTIVLLSEEGDLTGSADFDLARPTGKLVCRRFSINWLTDGKEDYSSTW